MILTGSLSLWILLVNVDKRRNSRRNVSKYLEKWMKSSSFLLPRFLDLFSMTVFLTRERMELYLEAVMDASTWMKTSKVTWVSNTLQQLWKRSILKQTSQSIGKLQNLWKPLQKTLESQGQIYGHLQVWLLWTEPRLTPRTSAVMQGRPQPPPVNGGTFPVPRLRTAISRSPPLPSACSPLAGRTVRQTPRPMSSNNTLPVWRKIILMIMEMEG